MIDLYALEGARLVGRYLKRAVADGGDREARAGLALASLYGGYCLGPVNTTAGHAVAYPLGTRHHIAHGLACAVIFPHTLAFNVPAVAEKTARCSAALGLAGADTMRSSRRRATATAPDSGSRCGCRASACPRTICRRMADEAHRHSPPARQQSARHLTREAILDIYRRAY